MVLFLGVITFHLSCYSKLKEVSMVSECLTLSKIVILRLGIYPPCLYFKRKHFHFSFLVSLLTQKPQQLDSSYLNTI